MNHLRTAIIQASLVVMAGLWMASTPSAVHAQAPGRGVRGGQSKRAAAAPYQQRLSPYLDLLRADNSALSPYHSFVQPRQQFRQSQNRQAAEIRRLDRMIPRPGSTATRPERIQTGRGGTFNNYLHYYQFNPAAVR